VEEPIEGADENGGDDARSDGTAQAEKDALQKRALERACPVHVGRQFLKTLG